MHQVEPDRNLL